MSDPKQDFRYRDEAGVELEAFQVTASGRWATQDWPNWLQMQGSASEINKVYTDADHPKSLFINLEAGRFGIEEDAYVIFENGNIRVESGAAFDDRFDKVVPFAPRNLDAPSLEGFENTHRVDENNKLVKLTPEEVAALPPEPNNTDKEVTGHIRNIDEAPVIGSQASTLRPKAEIALELMLDGSNAEGILVLKQALADETDWCSCAPGQCANGPRWGCRQNSPLAQ